MSQLPSEETTTLPATPEEAQAEIGRLEGDKDFTAAYLDAYNDGHPEAQARMTDLHKIAAGEPPFRKIQTSI